MPASPVFHHQPPGPRSHEPRRPPGSSTALPRRLHPSCSGELCESRSSDTVGPSPTPTTGWLTPSSVSLTLTLSNPHRPPDDQGVAPQNVSPVAQTYSVPSQPQGPPVTAKGQPVSDFQPQATKSFTPQSRGPYSLWCLRQARRDPGLELRTLRCSPGPTHWAGQAPKGSCHADTGPPQPLNHSPFSPTRHPNPDSRGALGLPAPAIPEANGHPTVTSSRARGWRHTLHLPDPRPPSRSPRRLSDKLWRRSPSGTSPTRSAVAGPSNPLVGGRGHSTSRSRRAARPLARQQPHPAPRFGASRPPGHCGHPESTSPAPAEQPACGPPALPAQTPPRRPAGARPPSATALLGTPLPLAPLPPVLSPRGPAPKRTPSPTPDPRLPRPLSTRQDPRRAASAARAPQSSAPRHLRCQRTAPHCTGPERCPHEAAGTPRPPPAPPPPAGARAPRASPRTAEGGAQTSISRVPLAPELHLPEGSAAGLAASPVGFSSPGCAPPNECWSFSHRKLSARQKHEL